jgi:hypothetical protein
MADTQFLSACLSELRSNAEELASRWYVTD